MLSPTLLFATSSFWMEHKVDFDPSVENAFYDPETSLKVTSVVIPERSTETVIGVLSTSFNTSQDNYSVRVSWTNLQREGTSTLSGNCVPFTMNVYSLDTTQDELTTHKTTGEFGAGYIDFTGISLVRQAGASTSFYSIALFSISIDDYTTATAGRYNAYITIEAVTGT